MGAALQQREAQHLLLGIGCHYLFGGGGWLLQHKTAQHMFQHGCGHWLVGLVVGWSCHGCQSKRQPSLTYKLLKNLLHLTDNYVYNATLA